ncbi:hypothetical protein COO91_09836 (plasmid) [Nostoc flagelliforme CCNUN1]|uniref:Uncharacterized protein n=1 Tax=Nostoc flagelliforme CCNUN1 TaxID=2038116 RepID=A0A2K8T7K6_9NOSO|nr:hypothetical protein COO91_09836 [Nostoc flagelliforme CCNUN1]
MNEIDSSRKTGQGIKVMLASLVKKILGFINRHSGQNLDSGS